MSQRSIYVVVSAAYAKDFPDSHLWTFDGEGYHAVYRLEDGKPVEFIGSDGGEPEDQTLTRDWDWVAPALQAAYDRGYHDGMGGAS